MSDKCVDPAEPHDDKKKITSNCPVYLRLCNVAGNDDAHTVITAADATHTSGSSSHIAGEISATAYASAHNLSPSLVRECARLAKLKHTAYCYPPEALAGAVAAFGPPSALISHAEAVARFGAKLPAPAWHYGAVRYYEADQCVKHRSELETSWLTSKQAAKAARVKRSVEWKKEHYASKQKVRNLPIGISRHGNKYKASVYGAAGKRQIYCGLHVTIEEAIEAQDKVRELLGIKKEIAA